MVSNVTSELFKKYFSIGRLGSLCNDFLFHRKTDHTKRNYEGQPEVSMRYGRIKVDLDKVFRSVTSLEKFDYQIDPDNIESVCLFGSTLYNHFPARKVDSTGKRFYLFGPEILRETHEIRDTPGDIDLMVLLKNGLTNERVVVPKKTRKGDRADEKHVAAGGKVTKRKYDYGEMYSVDGAIAKIDVNAIGLSAIEGYRDERALGLHIAYRSIDQFINGVGQGDFLSEEVFKYGVPIVGQDKFRDVVVNNTNVVSVERKPLHYIVLAEDSEGNLNGKVLSI